MSWWSTPLTMSDALTAVGGVFSELVDDVEDTLDGMLGAPATPTTAAATPASTRGEQEGEAEGEEEEEEEDTAAPCTPTTAAAAASVFSAASPLRTPCAARGGVGSVAVDESEVSRLVGAIQAVMRNGGSGGGGEEPASIDAVCSDIEMELAVEGAVLEATLVAMGAAAVRSPDQHDHFVERLDAVARLAVITLESPSVPQTPSPTKLVAAASTSDASYSCKMYSQTAHLKRAVETLLRNM